MYAVVDIETTGGNAKTGRIIEIAVAIFDGNKIIDSFESLINPYRNIPPFITQLTGINSNMLVDAPGFHHVAKKFIQITAGCIFVAHNVSFDYSYIKQEYLNLGYDFNMPKICTLKESRKTFPKLKSHGLGNICKEFEITNINRHRAMGDVLATVELLKLIMQAKNIDFANSEQIAQQTF